MKRINLAIMFLLALCLFGFNDDGCDGPRSEPRSASGVTKATAKVATGSDGLTAEQRNVKDRLAQDNLPGSIKHLYVLSAYSGQVLIYSTVRGKVTSGSKRLTPTSVNGGHQSDGCGHQSDGWYGGFDVDIGGQTKRTNEVLQDDGTYGSSGDYLFWFDSKGIYHQHYVQGGQILHVSSEPLAVKSIVLNMETKSVDEPAQEDVAPVKITAAGKKP